MDLDFIYHYFCFVFFVSFFFFGGGGGYLFLDGLFLEGLISGILQYVWPQTKTVLISSVSGIRTFGTKMGSVMK